MYFLRTKRIVLVVEFALCIIGIISANYITYEYTTDDEKTVNLLCNLAIGLATGGLVAMLIEFPQFFEVQSRNIRALYGNVWYIYMHMSEFRYSLEQKIKKPQERYTYNFSKRYLKKIAHFSHMLLTIDDNIYLCETKNKEIAKLKDVLHNISLYYAGIFVEADMKYNSIMIAQNEQAHVTNGMVEQELVEEHRKISGYIETVEHVTSMVYSKQQIAKWTQDKINIQKSIIEHIK